MRRNTNSSRSFGWVVSGFNVSNGARVRSGHSSVRFGDDEILTSYTVLGGKQ